MSALISELEIKVDKILSDLNNIFPTNFSESALRDLYINGSLEIKGTLTVGNLTVKHLNGIPMNALINDCLRTDNTTIIGGVKTFPSINFIDNNLKIKNLNGIPLKNIEFSKDSYNPYNIDLSKINKLQINGDLNFSKVFDIVWEDLMQKLVFKNEKTVIHGDMIILGVSINICSNNSINSLIMIKNLLHYFILFLLKNMTSNVIKMDYLNDIKYPSGYIQTSSSEDAYMTSTKYFETLTVTNLKDVKTINGIDIDDFIQLNANQTLEHLITFDNLVIDESLQVNMFKLIII
jgi:hypothetical protein